MYENYNCAEQAKSEDDDSEAYSFSYPSYSRFTFTGKSKSRLGRNNSRLNRPATNKEEIKSKEEMKENLVFSDAGNHIIDQAPKTPSMSWLRRDLAPPSNRFTPSSDLLKQTANTRDNQTSVNDSGIDVSSQSNFLLTLKNDSVQSSNCKRSLGFNNSQIKSEQVQESNVKDLNQILQPISFPRLNFACHENEENKENLTLEKPSSLAVVNETAPDICWNKLKKISDSAIPKLGVTRLGSNSIPSTIIKSQQKPSLELEPFELKKDEDESLNTPLDLSSGESLTNKNTFTKSLSSEILGNPKDFTYKDFDQKSDILTKEGGLDTLSGILPKFLAPTNKTYGNEPSKLDKSPPSTTTSLLGSKSYEPVASSDPKVAFPPQSAVNINFQKNQNSGIGSCLNKKQVVLSPQKPVSLGIQEPNLFKEPLKNSQQLSNFGQQKTYLAPQQSFQHKISNNFLHMKSDVHQPVKNVCETSLIIPKPYEPVVSGEPKITVPSQSAVNLNFQQSQNSAIESCLTKKQLVLSPQEPVSLGIQDPGLHKEPVKNVEPLCGQQKTYLAPQQSFHNKVSNNFSHMKSDIHQPVNDRPSFTALKKPCDNFKMPAPRGMLTRANTELYVNNKVYTTLSMLGRGGSSEVYQVLDSKTSKLLAVKCVDLSMVDKTIAEGYLNEIDLLSKLQGCSSVIKMFDYEFVQEYKMLYVVMEKGDTDLSHLIRDISKTKKISMSMIIYYWTEMLNAVKDIHDRGIIHSDLKPANFLLVSGRLKLIDFGIASSQGDMTSVFKEVTTGTWNYMSPEALKNTNASSKGFKITYKSDVWSLGCILYNLVYGRTPFSHITNTWGKLQAIADPSHQIEFPEVGAPPVLSRALRSCFHRDPKQRPTVAELLGLPYHSTSDTNTIGRQVMAILPAEWWIKVSHLFPEVKREEDVNSAVSS